MDDNKLVIFEKGSAKWIEIVPGQPARFHSSIDNATRFDLSFKEDKAAINKLLVENNLSWLSKTLTFNEVTPNGIWWKYVPWSQSPIWE